MTLVKRGNRWQCLNADVGSLPTTGVTANTLLEVCDTNVWMYFNGTSSSWVTLGTNTLSPIFSVPGDVAGTTNTSMSANGPFWWNYGDAQGDLGSAAGFLPFAVTNTKTAQDLGYLEGQKLLETDTGNWFRWDGVQWLRDQSGNPVGSTVSGGGNSEKGGGVWTNTFTTTTQSVFNIPHGIGAIPSIFMVCPASAAAGGGGGTTTTTIGYSVTANATNIVVTYQAGLVSTAAVSFNWLAID